MDSPASVFDVKMGGPETTDQIMATLGFRFNQLINQTHFPLTVQTPWVDEIELIHVPNELDLGEGIQLITDHGLDCPTHEHAIRFAGEYGCKIEIRGSVIFVHEGWVDQRRKCRFIALACRARHRFLYLSYPDITLKPHCLLAGVRPRRRQSI